MEKRLALEPKQRGSLRPLSTALLLLIAALAFGLLGCSEEENTDVTQTPYPEPEVQPWFFSVWGTAADNVWAVGQPGLIMHWNGAEWSLQEIGEHVFTDVWGTSANDVFVVGHGGVIYRWNGSSWSEMDSGSEENFYAVGTGPYDEIYACGERGNIRQLSGSRWIATENAAFRYNDDGEPNDTLLFSEDIQSLATVGRYAFGGDLAAVIMENDDPERQWWWGPQEDTSRSFIRACTSSDTVSQNYMGLQSGRILRYSVDDFGDSLWKRVTDPFGNRSDPITYPHAITGMWLDLPGERMYLTTWAAEIATWQLDGTDTELLWAGTGWLSDIWGAGDGQLWAVGDEGRILHASDGATFTAVDVPLPETGAAKNLRPATDKFGRIVP